jgi:ABC-type multidrug transport system fused ATPase/permease subunit
MLVDGARLDDSNRRAWQNSAGYVPQNVFIADATLAENVAFGENLPDAERVAESLEAAGLAEFARNLPEGIDALVGESGCRVSGGERQRIGIARALYRRPDILFLDEATSALDRESERNIHDTLARLSGRDKELTIVAIAHDEASLGYCDRIIEIGKEHV